jgi:hypothetical protein
MVVSVSEVVGIRLIQIRSGEAEGTVVCSDSIYVLGFPKSGVAVFGHYVADFYVDQSDYVETVIVNRGAQPLVLREGSCVLGIKVDRT